MKRKKNLFGEALILYKNQKKIAKISARNRNVDWLQVKIAEIKKDKKKLERKKMKNVNHIGRLSLWIMSLD